MNLEKTKSKVALIIDTSLEMHHFALYDESLLWHIEKPMQVSMETSVQEIADKLKVFQAPGCIMLAIGPGSYTGLRWGHSLALGLATALEVPVLPFSSFMAYSSREKDSFVLFDARAGGLYGAGISACGKLTTQARRLNKTFESSYELLIQGQELISPEADSLNESLIEWPKLIKAEWSASRCKEAACYLKKEVFPFKAIHLEYLKQDHEVPSFKI